MRSPVARQAFPDQLRGLALLGIVVVNAPFLGLSGNGFTSASLESWPDVVAGFGVVALAQGKFYLIFAFLFGYSCTFVLRDGSSPFRSRFRRRLLVLAGIGLFHAVGFFVGDILVSYAVLGTGLLVIYGRPDHVVRRVAVGAYAVATGWLVVVTVAALAFPDGGADVLAPLDVALAEGTPAQAVVARAASLPVVLVVLGSLNWGYAFGAFCVGLLAARHQALADLRARESLWRRLAVVGLGVGLPTQLLAAWMQVSSVGEGLATTPRSMAGLALGFATAPALSAGYVGVLALLAVRRPSLRSVGAAAGRMSLTLYVGESVLLSIAFCGYGFGLFGRWGALGVTIAGIVAWALLDVVAGRWLARFGQGPLERLLARLTRMPA